MVTLIPNSNGEDNAPSLRLREYNRCHNPAGSPAGGQFCSAPDAGGGGGPQLPSERRAEGGGGGHTLPESILRLFPEGQPIRQSFPARKLTSVDDAIALQELADRLADGGADEDRIAQAQFAVVQAQHPAVIREAEALIAKGKAAEAEFHQVAGLLKDRLGFSLHSNIMDPSTYDDPNEYVYVGTVKGRARTSVKAVLDYEGDVSQVKDILRGTIAVKTAAGLHNALLRLAEVADLVPHQRGVKNGVERPMPTGYRDLNVLVRLRGSGMLAEFQILTKPMLKAKMTTGHHLYTKWRALTKGTLEWQRLHSQMNELYNRAWDASVPTGVALAVLATTVQGLRGR